MVDKIERLTQDQKNDIRKLLEGLSLSIKDAEKKGFSDTNVDDNIDDLMGKINDLETNLQAQNFLDSLRTELAVLNDYSEYKNILSSLEGGVNEISEKYNQSFQNQLGNLQKQVKLNPHTVTSEEIKKVADEGRNKASLDVHSIVDNIAEGQGFWAKIARKANNINNKVS